MNTVYPLSAPVVLRVGAETGGWRKLLQRLQRACITMIRTWQTNRRMRAECATLAQLDAATMRDLGIQYSEIGSYVAEAHGVSEVTRRRVVRRNHEVTDASRARFLPIDYFR